MYGIIEFDVKPSLLQKIAARFGCIQREVERDFIEGLARESQNGIGDGETRIGDVVLVVCLVEAFVVIPIEVGAGLHQHVRLENEVALFRLYGESLASGQGHHAVVSVEVYWFVVDFSDAFVVALLVVGCLFFRSYGGGGFFFRDIPFQFCNVCCVDIDGAR